MSWETMRRRHFITQSLGFGLMGGCAALPVKPVGKSVRLASVRPKAPFDMPTIHYPDFSISPRFFINDFGAIPDDKIANNQALKRAIEAAHTPGGGVVVVPKGRWQVGAIHLKSHVNLHLDKDAILEFSENPDDYLPVVQTSWEGLECMNYSPLIYAFDCEHIALTGQGTLLAKLDIWREWYKRPKAHLEALVALYHKAVQNIPVTERDMTMNEAHLRPQFVQFNRCRHVLIQDIAIQNSPFWTIHTLLCKDVVVRRVNIRAHGHNNDGIDPEMTQNMLIEHCVFDQGDDAISVKSGREFDGWRLAQPSKNIVIRHCRIINGHQLLAVGSELSGGIENIYVTDCHFDQTGSRVEKDERTVVEINNLLFIKTNERRGGYVRNIHMTNISATKLAGGPLCIETDVLYQWRTLVPTYERRLTPIENIYMDNIKVDKAKFRCKITADQAQPVKGVRLSRIRVNQLGPKPMVIENVIDLKDKDDFKTP